MQNHIEEIVRLLKEYNLDVISIQADGMGQFQGPNAYTVFYTVEMGERSKMQNHIEEIAKLLKDSGLFSITINRNGKGFFTTLQSKEYPFHMPEEGMMFFRESQVKLIEDEIGTKKKEIENLEILRNRLNHRKNVFGYEK